MVNEIDKQRLRTQQDLLYYGSLTVAVSGQENGAANSGATKLFLFVLKINANATEIKKNQRTNISQKHRDLQ